MWFRSIGFKLIASVGAVAVVAVGMFFAANLRSQREQLLQEMVRNVHLASEIIRRSLHYDMLKYQPERLHRAIDTIGGHERIEKVRIFNALGRIIYSSDRTEMGKLVDKSAEQCYACHAKEEPFERLTTSARSRIFHSLEGYRVLGMITPIYNEPDCFTAPCHVHPADQKVLGVLDIDVNLSEVDQIVERSRRRMILFSVGVICAILGIIALLVQRLVNRPVKRLLDGTRQVAGGRLDLAIEVASSDELGLLARSFNAMIERLKESERELRASEEKYRSLFENDPNPIFVLDVESFRILDVNIRAVETYGYGREEFLGMSFLDLGEETEAERLRTLAVQGCIFLPRVRHRKKNGEVVYVNVHSCPRLHLGKDVIIANIADITDRIQAEAQLIQAGKMATLGEMSAGVAHELNQPLNALRIGCEFIQKQLARGIALKEEVLDKVSREMVTQVERAARIIDHLREFGRKSEGDEMEPVDINQPIRDVFTLLGQQLKIREIQVVLDLAPDLPPVLGVATRLEQVFLNLVMNARDAIEEKRRCFGAEPVEARIEIRTFVANRHVVVTVSDTGIGMSEAVRERIFEPFFTTKEVGKGTGLGLSISYGIVKECGGSIDVSSEEGTGTAFRLTFPAWLEKRDFLEKPQSQWGAVHESD